MIAGRFGQVIRQVIVITLVGTVDVTFECKSRWAVDRAGEDRQVGTGAVPEKVGATSWAKSASRGVGCVKPGGVACDHDVGFGSAGGGDVKTAGFAALLAMASDDRSQRSFNFIADRAAVTATGCHMCRALVHRQMTVSAIVKSVAYFSAVMTPVSDQVPDAGGEVPVDCGMAASACKRLMFSARSSPA